MGLMRTAARTAVITSTATRVHGRAAARQQNRWAAQSPAPVAAPAPAPAPAPPAAPAPAPADNATMIAQLTQLGELKAAGVLTEVEFEVQKARILQGL